MQNVQPLGVLGRGPGRLLSAKSTGYSFRGPGFKSKHPHDGSELPWFFWSPLVQKIKVFVWLLRVSLMASLMSFCVLWANAVFFQVTIYILSLNLRILTLPPGFHSWEHFILLPGPLRARHGVILEYFCFPCGHVLSLGNMCLLVQLSGNSDCSQTA